jgi:hypothetical protein
MRDRRSVWGAWALAGCVLASAGCRGAPAGAADAGRGAATPFRPVDPRHAVGPLITPSKEPAPARFLAADVPPAPAAGALGGPRTGLDAEQLAHWEEGRRAFLRVYGVEDGLGPHFNAQSCATCHDLPTHGGGQTMAHAARAVFEPPEFVEIWPLQAIPGFEPLKVPEGKGHVVSMQLPPPLYGLGLLEAVSDETMARNCGRPATEDGVRYAYNRSHDGRPGRIGRKSHNRSILDFVASAMTSELGLTNKYKRDPRFKTDKDAVPDPEVPPVVVERLAEYAMYLAPPPREGAEPAGEALFDTVGCTACHMPAPDPAAAGAYSDLCLHSLGPELDTRIPDHDAHGDQWRTAPLWGLRLRKAYFHDGRPISLDAAIRLHGGEGAASARRYAALAQPERDRLLTFLGTL